MSLLLRILLLSIYIVSATAWADGFNWLHTNRNATNQNAQVLFSAKKQADGQTQVLINVELIGDWKTYWRSPGEGGSAPKITWSSQVENIDWQWPTPQRFVVSGLPVQGYQHEVVFPITLTTHESHLSGVLTLSTCNSICTLTDYPFDIDLTTPAADNFDYQFTRALSAIPLKEGMIKQAKGFYADGVLTIEAERPQGWQNPDIFFDVPEGTSFSKPVLQQQGDIVKATVQVSEPWGKNSPQLQGQTIDIVISDQDVAQSISVPIRAAIETSPATMNIWLLAGFALLGGLILNLMPCVLPVLGMKLGSILRVEQREQKSIRKQFLLSASGIIASFMFLAALMTVLRVTQQAVGWGIQFQNVWFIGFMVLITAIFSANLLDLFSIHLSSRLSTRLATTGGHFWEGAFATLLATPCSAPFLGTAVAYALAAPYSHLWLIFILLAVGMSLPWLLIAAIPKIALCLPKPGHWMNVLRVAMGMMMLLSSFWLLSLLIVHIGWIAFMVTLIIIASLLLILIARRYGYKALGYSLISMILFAGILFGINKLMQSNTILEDKLNWQPVSEAAIESALKDNKLVFIDVTADWCITCKMNKLNVLMDEEVQQQLLNPNIITLKGDWTVPSSEITEFLKQRGALAVPFNQIYSPNHPEGIILPTLLDKASFLALIQQELKE